MKARRKIRILAKLLLLVFISTARAEEHPDWTTPIAPFQIADNLYYVGSRDLASYLVVTPKGNILINANLESSPPQIKASVEALGFKWADTKILLNSQAHFDHSAGTAEILRETHAKNYLMQGDVDVMESGGRKDFLAASGSVPPFPAAHVDHILHDGEVVTLGNARLTAHRTAGHTRGCTTWTMQVHIPGDPAGQLRNVVFVGGMSLWSDYHLIASPGHPDSYPGVAADFRHTFQTLRSLPCDLFLGAHGVYFNMLAKLQSYPAQGPKVFVDTAGYRKAIDEAEAAFNKEYAKQEAALKSTN
jgi:metallo-beta-lactamase class B